MIRDVIRTLAAIGLLSLIACSQSDANENSRDLSSAPVAIESGAIPLDESVDGFEALLNEYLALNQRLENVAYRVLSANAENCPETRQSAGMKIHTIHDYPDELQSYARAFFSLDDHPQVRVVADGSPAFNTGLMPGDRVLKLGEYSLVSGENAGQFFDALSAREFLYPSTSVEFERNETKQVLNLQPHVSCGYPAQLFYSEVINAHTNGEEIWVTSELMRQVESDTSLALIIAHELAHAVQGHMHLEPSKALELEADRLSLIYLARAGYDAAEAVRLWQANPLNHERDEAGFHPSRAERLDALSRALSEVNARP